MSKKNETNKANDYPVIYSYIYERESEDIKRLAGKFSTTKKANAAKTGSVSAIRGFKIEEGKAVPIYSDKSEAKPSTNSENNTSTSLTDKSEKIKKVVAVRKSTTNKGKKN